MLSKAQTLMVSFFRLDLTMSTSGGNSVKRIDQDSRHQISSGTVIETLATAVKELLENSLDAGATTVDIRITDHGTESIEVSDNGHGIAEADFPALALKSHTSKITEFDDLMTVESFGFRGEAISALAALGDLSIQTKTNDATLAYLLKFNRKGEMIEKKLAARNAGTTVTVKNLFAPLPVRRDQFVQNTKKELLKLIRTLNGYGVIGNVKLSCVNIINGKSVQLLRLNGRGDMLTNIREIFPAATVNNLIPLRTTIPNQDILDEYGIRDLSVLESCELQGWISSCRHGVSRSSSDQQFLYFNKRPCDHPKIVKLINQVYREYNSKEYPFFAINIQLERKKIDINIVPNKNQVMVEDEKVLLAVLKASVRQTFQEVSSSIPLKLLPPRMVFQKDIASNVPERSYSPKTISFSKPVTLPPLTPGTVNTSGAAEFFESLRFGAKVTDSAGKRVKNSERSPLKAEIKRKKENLAADKRTPTGSLITDYTTSIPVLCLDPPYAESAFGSQIHESRSVVNEAELVNKKAGYGREIQESESVIGTQDLLSQPVFSQFSTAGPSVLTNLNKQKSFGEFRPVGFDSEEEREIQRPESPTGFGNFRFSRRTLSLGSCNENTLIRTDISGSVVGNSDEILIDGMAIERSGTKQHCEAGPSERVDYSTPPRSASSVEAMESQLRDDLEALEAEVTQELLASESLDCDLNLHTETTETAGNLAQLNNGRLLPVQRSASDVIKLDKVNQWVNTSHTMSHEPTITKDCVLDTASLVRKLQSTVDKEGSSRKSAGNETGADRPIGSIPGNRCVITLPSSQLTFKRIQASRIKAAEHQRNHGSQHSDDQFRADITPTQNETAESELQRNIQKSDFQRMKVIGQFNDGFIIVRLDMDIFIIDQHASDERFNYEMLQQNFTVDSQRMVCPQPLELSVTEETILTENINIFRKNGFDFLTNTEANSRRISLSAVPMSHNLTFGKEDVMEMLHLLEDAEGIHVRPSRVLQLLASKACRKSVMIGKPLNAFEMKTIVSHMSNLKEPWRCAHGRPTMRHLFNIGHLENLDRIS